MYIVSVFVCVFFSHNLSDVVGGLFIFLLYHIQHFGFHPCACCIIVMRQLFIYEFQKRRGRHSPQEVVFQFKKGDFPQYSSFYSSVARTCPFFANQFPKAICLDLSKSFPQVGQRTHVSRFHGISSQTDKCRG